MPYSKNKLREFYDGKQLFFFFALESLFHISPKKISLLKVKTLLYPIFLALKESVSLD